MPINMEEPSLYSTIALIIVRHSIIEASSMIQMAAKIVFKGLATLLESTIILANLEFNSNLNSILKKGKEK
jgi:hypothetical protein